MTYCSWRCPCNSPTTNRTNTWGNYENAFIEKTIRSASTFWSKLTGLDHQAGFPKLLCYLQPRRSQFSFHRTNGSSNVDSNLGRLIRDNFRTEPKKDFCSKYQARSSVSSLGEPPLSFPSDLLANPLLRLEIAQILFFLMHAMTLR